MEKGKRPELEISKEAKVSDLFKDGEWINLHIDVGDATICLAFEDEGFQKFKEAINKPPVDLNAPIGKEPKSLTPEEIEKICKEQYTKTGAVLPPQYCLACQKCAIGAVVKFVGRDP